MLARLMGDQQSRTSQYDLFQIDGGYRMWCTQVMGLMYAGFKLRELSVKSPNECYAVHRSTNEVVARMNVPSAKFRAPLVFKFAYDLAFADKIVHELAACGYRASYAAANDLAYAILTAPMKCDAFLLGYGAPIETRRKAAVWLRGNYPNVPIIALKSPSEPDVVAAHFNLELDGDGALLPTLAQALNSR
jgi:hypothetical protein